MDRVSAIACLSVAFAAAAAHAPRAQAEDVTIYRCTDAGGSTTLRDTPCAKGQQQETRSMVRPKDAPSRVGDTAPRPRPEPAPAPAPTRTMVYAPPQPMYECRMPDGDTYTSDSPEGNPRWVPLWTLGYPVVTDGYYRPGGTRIVRHGDGTVDVNVDGGGYVHGPAPTIAGYGAGTWVHDECHMLPPSETCARLRDRREDIGKRFFNAQPTEREQLNREQRGIDARLDNDCGRY